MRHSMITQIIKGCGLYLHFVLCGLHCVCPVYAPCTPMLHAVPGAYVAPVRWTGPRLASLLSWLHAWGKYALSLLSPSALEYVGCRVSVAIALSRRARLYNTFVPTYNKRHDFSLRVSQKCAPRFFRAPSPFALLAACTHIYMHLLSVSAPPSIYIFLLCCTRTGF